MNLTLSHATCAECNETFIELSFAEQRKPCPQCGSYKRRFDEKMIEAISLHFSFYTKIFRGKYSKKSDPAVKMKSGDFYSYKHQKAIDRKFIVDREKNLTSERILDKETGEVLFFREEPLSEHKGHGSDKKKKV